MKLSQESLGSLDPLARRMVDDAFDLVMTQGKCFVHSNAIVGYLSGDKFRSYSRMLERNKGKIAGEGLKVVAAGLLGGPIGVAAAVGSAVAVPLARYAYINYRIKKADAAIKAHTGEVYKRIDVTVKNDKGEMVEQQHLVADDSWSEIMAEVAYLCKHKEMVKALDACMEIHADYDKFDTRYGWVGYEFRNCNEAWTFLEHAARVGYRFNGVAGVSKHLLNLNEFVVIKKSALDEEFENTRLSYISAFVLSARSDSLSILNAAANSSAVFNHSYGFRKDYSTWIRAEVGQIVRRDPAAMSALTTQGLAQASASESAQGVVRGGLESVGVETVLTGGDSMRVALHSAVQHSNVRDGVVSGLTSASEGLAGNALSSAAAGGISSGVSVVIDVAIESLERYLQMKALKALWEKKERLDRSGAKEYDLHRHFSADDLELLRANATELVTKLIEKLDHLMVAHAKYMEVKNAGGTNEVRAQTFLRRQKLSGQVDALYRAYQLFVFFFFGRANYIDEQVENITEVQLRLLNDFMKNHDRKPICDGLVCYCNSEKRIRPFMQLGLIGNDETLQSVIASKKWNNVPFNPIPGSAAGLFEKFK